MLDTATRQADVSRALETASTDDILEALPDGLDTVVAERGRTFSGGQRQRLVLARALAGDPEILVLVEPTSAVDAHTEARIAARLRGHREGRTTVVVTSSPLVLDAVDEVAFLRGGRVVATGTHARPARDRRRLPRRRDPRARAGRGRLMSVHTALPIADSRSLRRYVRGLARRHPRLLWTALALHITAALAALAAPRLIGDLVQAVDEGTTVGHVDRIILVLAGFLVAQTVLTRYARLTSQVLGEQVLAELREDFVGNALALPVGVVESAGSGDLLTRTSRDVDQLGWSVRWALPEWTIAVVTAVVTFVAAVTVGWWVLLPVVLGLPPLVVGLRWYLARAKAGYLRESASYSAINATLTETVEGARTVEALGLGPERIAAIDEDIKESYAAERYTLYLRTVFFPSMELSYLIPTVATLLLGGYLYTQGSVTLGEVTAATLYVQMLIDPVDRIVSILDELQMGAASLARLLGVAQVPDDREVTGAEPVGEQLDARDVRFSYVDGPRRAARRRPRRRGRRADRHGRAVGRRQVDARPAAGRHPPAAHRRGDRRRRRPGRAAARRPARPRRPGDPGAPRLRRHPAREPRAGRASGRHRRRHPRVAVGRRRPRVGRGAARGARHGGRLRRPARSPPPRPSRSRWPGWCSPTRTRWSSTRPPR